MHAHVRAHARTHARIHASYTVTHSCTRTHSRTQRTHPHLHPHCARTRTYTDLHTQTHRHTDTHTPTRAHTHDHAHPPTDSPTLTRIRTRTHRSWTSFQEILYRGNFTTWGLAIIASLLTIFGIVPPPPAAVPKHTIFIFAEIGSRSHPAHESVYSRNSHTKRDCSSRDANKPSVPHIVVLSALQQTAAFRLLLPEIFRLSPSK